MKVYASEGRSELPPVLYHYTHPEAFYNIIETRRVWATDLRFLNDEQEFQNGLEFIKRFGEEISWNANSLGEARVHSEGAMERENYGLDENRRPLFVFAMSSERDCLSQWRSYCPKTGGIAIGFDTKKLCQQIQLVGIDNEKTDENSFYLGQVLYGDKEKAAMLEKEWAEVVLKIGGTTTHPLVSAAGQMWAFRTWRMMPLFKSHQFHEEKEWRVIFASSSSFPVHPYRLQPNFRPTKACVVPYREFCLSTTVEEMPIKEIVVGPSYRRDFAKRALHQFLFSKGLMVNVEGSEIPFREP